jgi:predicted 2-oxoglutarate/Fe(II)-dependent dioxygenase YbiX
LLDEKKRTRANELNEKIQSLLSSDSDLNKMVLLELLQNLIGNNHE